MTTTTTLIDSIEFEYADPHDRFRPSTGAEASAQPGTPGPSDDRASPSRSVLVVSIIGDLAGRDRLHLELVTRARDDDRSRLDRRDSGFAPSTAGRQGEWPDDADDVADYAALAPARLPAHSSHRQSERSIGRRWARAGLGAVLAVLGTVAVLGSRASTAPAALPVAVDTGPTSWEQERAAIQVQGNPRVTVDTGPTSWQQERAAIQVQGDPLAA